MKKVNGVRADVAADGFWPREGPECSFLDIQVFKPYAPANMKYEHAWEREEEGVLSTH